MVLRKRDQFAEVVGQFFRARAHFGHHRAQQHGGAKRLQRVFRPAPATPAACAGRRVAGPPAPRRSRSAANSSEAADLLLAAIERTQPRFGVADPGLDAAHLGGDVDQLLIELAAVLADRRDIGLQLLLRFGGALLLRAGGFQFLLALLDGVGRGGGRLRARAASCAAAGDRRCRQGPRTTRPAKAGYESKPTSRGRRCQGRSVVVRVGCIEVGRRFRCKCLRLARLKRGDRDGPPKWSRPDKSVPEA